MFSYFVQGGISRTPLIFILPGVDKDLVLSATSRYRYLAVQVYRASHIVGLTSVAEPVYFCIPILAPFFPVPAQAPDLAPITKEPVGFQLFK